MNQSQLYKLHQLNRSICMTIKTIQFNNWFQLKISRNATIINKFTQQSMNTSLLVSTPLYKFKGCRQQIHCYERAAIFHDDRCIICLCETVGMNQLL